MGWVEGEGMGRKGDGITKPIKNDNPLVEGILEERHSYLSLDAENELTDKMKDDLHDIMVSAGS